jgi:hypothetical protein
MKLNYIFSGGEMDEKIVVTTFLLLTMHVVKGHIIK